MEWCQTGISQTLHKVELSLKKDHSSVRRIRYTDYVQKGRSLPNAQ